MLLNRVRIDRLEPANAAEVQLSRSVDVNKGVDPKSKDMTGDWYG